ncbi:MAG: general secretion pathway protein GspD [Bacteroidetes bacterium]|jgi:type IV pilus assembly protein PilQ|nr:general secretion pathway protein GspD [Bacteroidota bacterium]
MRLSCFRPHFAARGPAWTPRCIQPLLWAGWLLLFGLLVTPSSVHAQAEPERQLRTYIPPEQLVSFQPSTPLDQFIDLVNPLFTQVAGKQVIDPESRDMPIGISITRMQFFDAFERVLAVNDLTYRETERYFIVEAAPETGSMPTEERAVPSKAAESRNQPASLATPEIRISALLFEVNLTRVRELGLNWSVFIGQQSAQNGQNGTNQTQQGPRFKLRPKELGGAVGDFFRSKQIAAPDEIDFGDLAQFFRALEDDGVGQTLAQPTVAVQSSEQGRIQIGSDIPVQVRDFAGNTLTQFISTGIIVDVTPTLITEALADTSGAPTIDFVHLDVEVERSSGRPFGGSVAIDRNTANTQVLLLDEEETVIGGLYTTDVTTNRRGVPLLKDLPGWFFGLRYIFGRETKTIARRELVIVLQAEVVDPLPVRFQRERPDSLLEDWRREVQERIQRFDDEVREELGPQNGPPLPATNQ